VNRESPCTTDNSAISYQLSQAGIRTYIPSTNTTIMQRGADATRKQTDKKHQRLILQHIDKVPSGRAPKLTTPAPAQSGATLRYGSMTSLGPPKQSYHYPGSSHPHSKNFAGALRVLAALAAAGPHRRPHPALKSHTRTGAQSCTLTSASDRSTVRTPNIPANLHSSLNPRTSCTLGWCVSHPIGA
jgi:hypothetical protein